MIVALHVRASAGLVMRLTQRAKRSRLKRCAQRCSRLVIAQLREEVARSGAALCLKRGLCALISCGLSLRLGLASALGLGRLSLCLLLSDLSGLLSLHLGLASALRLGRLSLCLLLSGLSDLSRHYLSGLYLSGLYLSDLYLSDLLSFGLNLRLHSASALRLRGLNLSGLNLSGLNLSGLNLSGLNLSGLNLSVLSDLSVLLNTDMIWAASAVSGAGLSATTCGLFTSLLSASR